MLKNPEKVLFEEATLLASKTIKVDVFKNFRANIHNNPTLIEPLQYTDPLNPFLKREVFYF